MKNPKPIAGVDARYLTIDQVGELFGLSYEAVRRATQRGELTAVRIAGRLFYPTSQLPGHETPAQAKQKP